jgi:hypothetical protein
MILLVLIYCVELNQELKLFLFHIKGACGTQELQIFSATEVREEEFLKQAIPR